MATEIPSPPKAPHIGSYTKREWKPTVFSNVQEIIDCRN